MKRKKILVTGGAGFIGSAFVRLLAEKKYKVVVVDKLTYAGCLQRLKEVDGKYKFYKTDICNRKKIKEIIKKEKVEYIVHFAAETHVDRSIVDSSPFINTNVRGTQILLDLSREEKIKKFVHISTDEVYGDILKGKFKENSPIKASSPYAASKAAADLLVQSYMRTYDFPAVIVRASNNYGPWQYPEKFIPLSILKLLKNKKIPVYGTGKNVREWLYVDDCAKAVKVILDKAEVKKIYNLGSGIEKRNIDVAKKVISLMGKNSKSIEFVKDRLGHDFRYCLDSKKIFNEVKWKADTDFEKGISLTIKWCLENKSWLFNRWNKILKLYG